MNQKHKLFLLIIIANIIVLTGCASKPDEIKTPPRAVNGVLDLTNWDFEKDGLIPLDGEWEFYWEKLLSWKEFQQGTTIIKPGFIDVPRSWNKYEIDGNKLSGNGYATYRLTIKTGEDSNNVLGLKIPRIFTAYSLWADKTLIASCGKTSSRSEEATPQYYPKTVTLKPDNNTIQLVVQVSNFSHRSGGILESIKFGSEEEIIKNRENQLALELFLFGCLLITGVYHIVLFIFRSKDLAPLFFGVYCILIAIRTLFVGEIFFIQLFPGFNWEIEHKIQTLMFYTGVPVFVMFIKSIFQHEFSNKVLRVSQAAGACFVLLVLLTPARTFTIFNPAYQAITFLLAAYVAYVLFLACIKKRKGAPLITTGGVLFILTSINDILFLSVPFNDYNLTFLRHVIRTGNLSSFGLIVFTFTQSIVLAMNTSKAFSQVEDMSEKLVIADKQKDELLASLEDKVKERTFKLEQSNHHLEKAYENLTLVEKSRKRLLSNITHDLKTPITLIQGYTEVILDGIISDEDKLKKYLKLIHDKILTLNNMTNNLVELSHLESRQVKLNLQKVGISNLATNVESKYKYDVESAGLRFSIDIPGTVNGFINIDINQIDRVFSNLIYNAIKYTSEGSITVSCRISENDAVFAVSDTGVGIGADDLPYIFDRFFTASKSRNSSLKSSGLGLSIAKEIIKYHGGSIWADSKPGQGSSFYFALKKCN